ncbi:MAG: hypothetical protein EA339_13465 [Rhodobacteraceae bacterium]|nr:MAG: hypothetical protein EA339_13465 [Paracoccaceae bacterium]
MPTQQELLNQELDDILAELGLDGADGEDSDAISALSAEIAGTEFDMGAGSDVMKMLGADNDPQMEALIFNIIARQARRLIQRLIALARRYRNCPRCIALVTQAVAHFKAGRYAQAIATGTRAVACFRTCAS